MRALVLDVTPEDTSVEAAPAEPAAVDVSAPAVAALNIVHCPYSIFMFDNVSDVRIVHRIYPTEAMKMVKELSVSIVDDAVSL